MLISVSIDRDDYDDRYPLISLAVHYGVAYIKADWRKNQADISRSSKGSIVFDHHPHPSGQQHEKPTKNGNGVEPHNGAPPSFFQRFRQKHQRGNLQRFRRIKNSLVRVGSAVFIAGFTSFLAGVSMAPSKLTSFSQMGFFLMLIMFISWLFATWFFLPLLSFIGPIDQYGDIP